MPPSIAEKREFIRNNFEKLPMEKKREVLKSMFSEQQIADAFRSQNKTDLVGEVAVPVLKSLDAGVTDITSLGLLAASKLAKAVGSRAFDQGETAVRSFVEGQTAGISEPVIGAFKSATEGVPAPAVFTPGGIASFAQTALKKIIEGKSLGEGIQKDADERRALKEEFPKTAIGSEIAGILTPSPVNVGGKLFQGAKAAASGIRTLKGGITGAGLLSKGSRLGLAVAEKGLEGGLTAGGFTALRQASLEPTGYLKEGEENFVESAKTGAKFGVAIPALGKGLKALKVFGQGTLRVIFGMPKGVSGKYVARAKQIEQVASQKGVEGIRGDIEKIVQDVSDDIAAKKLSVKEADDFLKALKSDLSGKSKDLSAAITAETQRLRSIKPPTHIADDVVEGVSALKRRVTEGSKRARESLSGKTENISLSEVKGSLQKSRDSLKIAGKPPKTSSQASAYKEITNVIDDLNELGSDISLSEAKQVIKRLDDITSYVKTAGGFSDDASRAFAGARKLLNDTIRSKDKDFAKIMDEVAEDTRLLKQADKMFGQPSKAASTINQLGGNTKAEQRQILQSLSKKTGKNFESSFDEFRAAQARLKDRANIAKNLPELRDVRKATAKIQTAKGDLAKKNQALENIRKRVGDDVFNLATKTEGGRVRNIESAVKQLFSARPGEREAPRRLIKKLSEMTDQNLQQTIDDMGVYLATEGQFRAGSRNVNLGTVIGSAIGYLIGGGIGAGLGAPTGSVLGAAIDINGPRAAKQILKAVVAANGSKDVFISKLGKLPIPKSTKDAIMKALGRSQVKRTVIIRGARKSSPSFDALKRRSTVGSKEEENQPPR